MKNKIVLSDLTIKKASLEDYPTIQNMARFYVYDMSRQCGFISDDWACPPDGLYESYDFKKYFEEADRRAFLIQIQDELVGFVLLNQLGNYPETNWNMGEFFILAKFQGRGVGQLVASKIWNMHEGFWEVAVIPENKQALAFWRQTIAAFTNNQYTEELKIARPGQPQPNRYILRFSTSSHHKIIPFKTTAHFTLAFVDHIDDGTENRMESDLKTEQINHGIDINYHEFYLVISNTKDEIVGVLEAYTLFAEIYVNEIWVDSRYRNQGLGSQLLDALETHYQNQGFNNINLCTSAFQAVEFYKKCGYVEEFTRINKTNPQFSKTFFVKFFNEEKQTQGLLK